MLICDNFGMRELTPTQADDLYELVCARAAAGHSLVLTSNRSPVGWYPLFPNPVAAESLLDRLINTSHQVRAAFRRRPGPRWPADRENLARPGCCAVSRAVDRCCSGGSIHRAVGGAVTRSKSGMTRG